MITKRLGTVAAFSVVLILLGAYLMRDGGQRSSAAAPAMRDSATGEARLPAGEYEKVVDANGANSVSTNADREMGQLPPRVAFPQQNTPGAFFGKGVGVSDIPEGRFRNEVAALEPEAQTRLLGILEEFSIPKADVPCLSVTPDGYLIYACNHGSH